MTRVRSPTQFFPLLLLFACTSNPPQTLTVFAAASLRESFTQLARDFERAHPGVDVQVHVAGTPTLALQLRQGARADVFASADLEHTHTLAKEGLLEKPRVFAFNEPVWVVSPRSSVKLEKMEDLPRAKRIVLARREVPIGHYASTLLERYPASFRQEIYAHVVSYELDVKHVLARLELGEAEAGLVYRTDVPEASQLRVIPVAPEYRMQAGYSLAVTKDTSHRATAHDFVDWVLSEKGQAVLVQFGFLPGKEGR